MGLLDGQIAEAFAGVFGGLYLDATLYRPNAFADDGAGGGAGGGFDAGSAIKVQIDQATQAMRLADGFADTDQRMLVLAHGEAAISTDCEIASGSNRWMVESVSTDPCGSYYELRIRRKS
jgi:hypothetical protein